MVVVVVNYYYYYKLLVVLLFTTATTAATFNAQPSCSNVSEIIVFIRPSEEPGLITARGRLASQDPVDQLQSHGCGESQPQWWWMTVPTHTKSRLLKQAVKKQSNC